MGPPAGQEAPSRASSPLSRYPPLPLRRREGRLALGEGGRLPSLFREGLGVGKARSGSMPLRGCFGVRWAPASKEAPSRASSPLSRYPPLPLPRREGRLALGEGGRLPSLPREGVGVGKARSGSMPLRGCSEFNWPAPARRRLRGHRARSVATHPCPSLGGRGGSLSGPSLPRALAPGPPLRRPRGRCRGAGRRRVVLRRLLRGRRGGSLRGPGGRCRSGRCW